MIAYDVAREISNRPYRSVSRSEFIATTPRPASSDWPDSKVTRMNLPRRVM
jgi:hypothetical protein